MTDSSQAQLRRVFRVLVNPALSLFICGFLFLIFFRSFSIEPFDFDEALFRRMAEEAKAAGQWVARTTFNGSDFNYTSPLFIGLLALFSSLIDGPAEPMSSFVSRSSGLIFFLFNAFLLHRCWLSLKRRCNALDSVVKPVFRGDISPVYFLLMGALPVISATSLSPDLFFSFFTTLFFCSESRRIYSRFSIRKKTSLLPFVSAFAVFGGMLFSGVHGFVLPVVTSLLFSLLTGKSTRQRITEWLHFLPQLLLAALLSFLLFNYLFLDPDSSGSMSSFWSGFLSGRNQVAPDDQLIFDSLFSLMLVGVGCSLFISWLIVQMLGSTHVNAEGSSSQENATADADLVKVWLGIGVFVHFLFFLFFGQGRYTKFWIFLPLLALLASLGGFVIGTPVQKGTRNFLARVALRLPFVLPVLMFAAGIFVMLWSPLLSGWISLSPKNDALLSSFLEDSLMLSVGFFLSGLFFFVAAVVLNFWSARSLKRGVCGTSFAFGLARWVVLLQTCACAMSVLFIVPVAESVLTTAIQLSAAKARMFLRVGGQVSALSFYSPNLVSSNKESVLFDGGHPQKIFSNPDVSVVLTPVWNTAECTKNGFDIAQAVDYLRVCLRSYRQTLEGRQP
jgi:hypothetical protein